MEVLLLYHSFFGNTKKVAEAIGNAMDSNGQVRVMDIKTVACNRYGRATPRRGVGKSCRMG